MAQSPCLPVLRCVAQHWYELRFSNQPISSENNKRLTAIASLNTFARRHGIASLGGMIASALKGERAVELPFVLLAAGLFREEQHSEPFVLRTLRSQRLDYRIAATYASAFYLDRGGEVAVVVTERVLLPDGDPLLVQASREVVEIVGDVKNGGRCRRCGAMGGLPSSPRSLDWVPRRIG